MNHIMAMKEYSQYKHALVHSPKERL